MRSGTQLRPFSPAVMEACLKSALEVYSEVSAKNNPTSRRSGRRCVAFRNEEYLWWRVAEYTYDDFMIRNRTRT